MKVRKYPLGDLIVRRRGELGYSQEALADKAGVDIKTLQGIETGATGRPRAATLGKLATALQIDIKYLFVELSEMEKSNLDVAASSAYHVRGAEYYLGSKEPEGVWSAPGDLGRRVAATVHPKEFAHLKEGLGDSGPIRDGGDSRSVPLASEGVSIQGNGVPLPFQRPIDPPILRAALSSARLLQIALDTPSLSRAIDLVPFAIEGGAHLIEVGDPLIKNYGMDAIRQIRVRYPTVPLVAEFSSSDWVEDQIYNASANGANIVQVVGLSVESRVARAINAARSVGVGLAVGLPPSPSVVSWAKSAAALGADALAIIRNIDCGTTAQRSLQTVKAIRKNCDVPLAVSGGFSPNNISYALRFPWNILIVGSSFIDAPAPQSNVSMICKALKE